MDAPRLQATPIIPPPGMRGPHASAIVPVIFKALLKVPANFFSNKRDCFYVTAMFMVGDDLIYRLSVDVMTGLAEQCKSIWQNARAEAEKAAKSRLARKLRDAKSA